MSLFSPRFLQDSRAQKVLSGGGRELQVVVQAKQGLGLSLVSRDPHEELLYAFMSNVVVDYQTSPLQQILDGSIQYIQVRRLKLRPYIEECL